MRLLASPHNLTICVHSHAATPHEIPAPTPVQDSAQPARTASPATMTRSMIILMMSASVFEASQTSLAISRYLSCSTWKTSRWLSRDLPR
jgi:hypothetical protein